MKFRHAALPYMIWSSVFVLVPLGLVAVFAFTTGDGAFTIDNIARVSNYTPVFMRSVWLAILATAICLAIGFCHGTFSIFLISYAGRRSAFLDGFLGACLVRPALCAIYGSFRFCGFPMKGGAHKVLFQGRPLQRILCWYGQFFVFCGFQGVPCWLAFLIVRFVFNVSFRKDLLAA